MEIDTPLTEQMIIAEIVKRKMKEKVTIKEVDKEKVADQAIETKEEEKESVEINN